MVTDFSMMAAAHIGGEWTLIYDPEDHDGANIRIDDDFLDLLARANVQWVGFSVAVNVTSPEDSTVEFARICW